MKVGSERKFASSPNFGEFRRIPANFGEFRRRRDRCLPSTLLRGGPPPDRCLSIAFSVPKISYGQMRFGRSNRCLSITSNERKDIMTAFACSTDATRPPPPGGFGLFGAKTAENAPRGLPGTRRNSLTLPGDSRTKKKQRKTREMQRTTRAHRQEPLLL